MIWPASNVRNQIIIDRFYSFFEVHRDEGFHFPGETHNFWECVYVLNGGICVSGDSRVYSLTAGDIIFHKPMEFHNYFVDKAAGADLLIFSFSLDGMSVDILKNKVFSLSAPQQYIISSLMNYVRSKYDESMIPENNLIEHKYLLPFDRIPAYSQMLTSYVYQLILTLIGDGTVAKTSSAPDAQIFSKVVNYMNNRISEQPTISEIAEFCNTSESSLKRIFYKYAGISIHKYFLKLKINASTELLKNGHRVSETAEKLGFSSQAHFSAAYKRETGMNPSHIYRIADNQPSSA